MIISFHQPSGNPDGYGTVGNYIKGNSQLDLQDDDKFRDWGLVVGYPNNLGSYPAKNLIVYTMFESTGLPDFFIENLKLSKVKKVLVPSKFCKDVFEAHGIEAEICQLGYDSDKFHLIKDTRKEKKFTFLHYNAFNTRKGWMQIFNAFTRTFHPDKHDVQLIFKSTSDSNTLPMGDYPNITSLTETMDIDVLNQLINRSHCFLFPSMGEGFGLPPLEAMASGTPVIATKETGMRDYWHDYMISVKTKPVNAFYSGLDYGSYGKMFQADEHDLAQKMWYAYQQRKKIARWSKPIIENVKDYTMSNFIKEFDDKVSRYAKN